MLVTYFIWKRKNSFFYWQVRKSPSLIYGWVCSVRGYKLKMDHGYLLATFKDSLERQWRGIIFPMGEQGIWFTTGTVNRAPSHLIFVEREVAQYTQIWEVAWKGKTWKTGDKEVYRWTWRVLYHVLQSNIHHGRGTELSRRYNNDRLVDISQTFSLATLELPWWAHGQSGYGDRDRLWYVFNSMYFSLPKLT